MTPPPAALIAVDWGSTHLRAKLVLDGRVAALASSLDGIRHLADRDCDAILASHCAAWRHTHPEARVLVSGMAGAREGWREVPYVLAPCGLDDLASAVVPVPSETFGEALLVPGVRCDDPDRTTTDVMRGEETQVAGLLDTLPADGSVLCLPGTHSKWVVCRGGRIETFRTWLTGEAYERLTRDSLVSGDGSPADPESDAFRLGVESAEGPGGLLHRIFLGRTHLLAGRLAASEVRGYVSGLLVGHEIREGLAFSGDLPLILVGDSPAVAATASALRHLGVAHGRASGDAHLDGLLALAARLG